MRSSSARAHAVWLIGLLAYIVTAANRSSFGAVSTDAGERFDVSAGLLGSSPSPWASTRHGERGATAVTTTMTRPRSPTSRSES